MALLAGCPGSSGNAPGGSDGPPADLRILHDFAKVPEPSASVKGLALDEDGKPIANAFLSVCNASGCHSTYSAADGTFLISGVQLGDCGVRSHDDMTASPRTGVALRLLHLTMPDVVVDAGTLFVPRMPAGANLGPDKMTPQTVEVGDGVVLTLVRGDLEPPLGVDDTNVAARLIPPEHRPPFDPAQVNNEQVIAIYTFMPYPTNSKSPIGVRAPVAAPPGAEVHFRAVDEFAGKLNPPVIGHASKDGLSVATDPGKGVDRLSWLVITR